MTEKHQLQDNFSSLSQKKLEQETRVKDLTAEKKTVTGSLDSLSQKNQELEGKVRSLSDKLKKGTCEGAKLGSSDKLYISEGEKSWSDSRQYCRDRGGDLVIINTEEKQRFISSFIKHSVWIGLSDRENEGELKWVDNSELKQR
ncbi:C-type lectin domain family 4 member M-like [Puntigrus tetrazona]|uniref:C-type lectin domain family 4 member M-like n=1 Tax=Puntigrus tetrazona TaxID=1606681 RepID=UPI001C898A82|nr:C-type lectin domain family 4 member M-like [Puntigrus tetrazona]